MCDIKAIKLSLTFFKDVNFFCKVFDFHVVLYFEMSSNVEI